jgi:hypothetical protein
MADKVFLLIGTKKGAFIAESDAGRRSWSLRGPFCDTWPINHLIGDPATGRSTAPAATNGSARRSGNRPISARPGPIPARASPMRRARSRSRRRGASRPANGSLYAGVQPAGLFRSDDGGETWRHISGLRDHPTRPEWQPGGAGLILHALAIDPTDRDRIWVGISAAGVFHTADGGKTWEPRNKGTRADFLPEGQNYPEFGQCVHSLAMAPAMPPTASTSRTTAACTAATTAARAGRASRRACRRASASRRGPSARPATRSS